MSSISGFFLLDRNFDLGEKPLQKLRLMFKKLTLLTSDKRDHGFGYFKSSIDGESVDSKTFKTAVQEVWENDLKDITFNNQTNVFISKAHSYTKKKIQEIEPYIFEQTYSFLIGTTKNFKLDINPSEIIAKKGFLQALPELRDSSPTTTDFNLISINLKKPEEIYMYRGVLPFNVVYSFDLNCVLFTSNHKNIEFISKDDLLRLSKFLPINLDPYSAYIIDSTKISLVDQEILLGEDLCCKQLNQAIQTKILLLDFDQKSLYHPNDKISYQFCPFCGYKIEELIKE